MRNWSKTEGKWVLLRRAGNTHWVLTQCRHHCQSRGNNQQVCGDATVQTYREMNQRGKQQHLLIVLSGWVSFSRSNTYFVINAGEPPGACTALAKVPWDFCCVVGLEEGWVTKWEMWGALPQKPSIALDKVTWSQLLERHFKCLIPTDTCATKSKIFEDLSFCLSCSSLFLLLYDCETSNTAATKKAHRYL